MSGGHFEYNNHRINYLLEQVISDINGGKFGYDGEKWNDAAPDFYSMFAGCKDTKDIIKVVESIRALVIDLNRISQQTYAYDYWMSDDSSWGDFTGVEISTDEIDEVLKIIDDKLKELKICKII